MYHVFLAPPPSFIGVAVFQLSRFVSCDVRSLLLSKLALSECILRLPRLSPVVDGGGSCSYSSIINLSADINDCSERERGVWLGPNKSRPTEDYPRAENGGNGETQQHKWAIKTFNLLCSVFELWRRIKSPGRDGNVQLIRQKFAFRGRKQYGCVMIAFMDNIGLISTYPFAKILNQGQIRYKISSQCN